MTSFLEHAVRVRVPATSGNVGPGFDTFGLALTLYDTVEARVISSGVRLDVQGEGAEVVDRGERNLVLRAMRAAFDEIGTQPPGLAITCTNRIPHARGLGSSAAAVIAGVLAARALVDGVPPPRHRDILTLSTKLEGHPDNAAACLAGGLTIAWSDTDGPDYARVEPTDSVLPVVAVPEVAMSTAEARGLLPESVPHGDAAANTARAGLLIAAVTTRPDLLLAATEDRLHQNFRAPAMPQTAALVEKLRASGVPAVISGAGPTVLALCDRKTPDSINTAVGTGWHIHRLDVDRDGARVQTAATTRS